LDHDTCADTFTVFKNAFDALPMLQDEGRQSSGLAMDWEELDGADDALGEVSDLTEVSDDELGP